jgi:hypothetical protein
MRSTGPSHGGGVSKIRSYFYVSSKHERRLVAAVEIVSPSNKDRPEHRRVFAAKCAALLQQKVCVALVDVVTTRQFNLYSDLLELLGQTDPTLVSDGSEPPSLYATVCRWRRVKSAGSFRDLRTRPREGDSDRHTGRTPKPRLIAQLHGPESTPPEASGAVIFGIRSPSHTVRNHPYESTDIAQPHTNPPRSLGVVADRVEFRLVGLRGRSVRQSPRRTLIHTNHPQRKWRLRFAFATMHLGQGPAPVPLFILALGLGYLYQRTHRIWPSLEVHELVNLLAVLRLQVTVERVP